MFFKRRSDYAKTAKQNIAQHPFVVSLKEELQKASEKCQHSVVMRVPLGQMNLYKFLSDKNSQKLVVDHMKGEGVTVTFEKHTLTGERKLPKRLRKNFQGIIVHAQFTQ